MTFEETYPLMMKFVRVVAGPWEGQTGYVTGCGSDEGDVVHYGVTGEERDHEMFCRHDELVLDDNQNQNKPLDLRVKRG